MSEGLQMTNTTLSGPLTETERAVLYNALRVAAEQYKSDAQIMRLDGNERTAKQFEEQAISAERWADLIEECEALEITQ